MDLPDAQLQRLQILVTRQVIKVSSPSSLPFVFTCKPPETRRRIYLLGSRRVFHLRLPGKAVPTPSASLLGPLSNKMA